ncbi:MAG: hypothetical protein ACPG32_15135, partial [Akkermansiaceae bacterium]
HHLYWPHLPIFWLVVLGCACMLSLLAGKIKWCRAWLFLFVGVILHLALDTPVGGIAWFYPIQERLIYFVDVPAIRSWWVWNFILHWTFLAEIVICIAAVVVWLRKRKKWSNKGLYPTINRAWSGRGFRECFVVGLAVDWATIGLYV